MTALLLDGLVVIQHNSILFSVVSLHKPSTIHIFNQITNNIQMAQAFNASGDKTWVQGETTSFQLKALVQFHFKLSLSMNPISHSLSMHPTSVGTSVLDAILYLYLIQTNFKIHQIQTQWALEYWMPSKM